MPDIRVEHLRTSFGGRTVLHDVSFTVSAKEFVTLLGPSGCGKTTTLMSIAGFHTPDQGVIACGDETFLSTQRGISTLAERRGLGIVFQSYALWPHMTVAQNVAFPLRLRRLPRIEIRNRVSEVLALVELDGHQDKYPHQMSGGEQQRVALARAIGYSPKVLLLDEPFSNLDAKLRERARDWLRRLHHSLGLTTVFVTHDQAEAMSVSDRILVMNDGRIVRDGTPEEVYREPRARFAAGFIGQCNFLTGTVSDGTTLITPEFPHGIPVRGRYDGPTATIAVRPEDIELTDAETGTEGTVTDVSYLGDHYRYQVTVGISTLIMHARQRLGQHTVHLRVAPDAATFVD
jgi:iron(III) transport system ATP-binding protein